jgi:hypothetical protein
MFTDRRPLPAASWRTEITRYDALEVHPVRDWFWNDAQAGSRPFPGELDRETCCEQCAPHEAHFWSVFGHLVTGGLECFADFPSQAEAEAFAERVRAEYAHLRET